MEGKEEVRVFVKVVGHPMRDVSLVLSRDTTIQEVKKRIEAAHPLKMSLAQQKLLYCERALNDQNTLADILLLVSLITYSN